MKVHLVHLQTGRSPSAFCQYASSEDISCLPLPVRELEYLPLGSPIDCETLLVCTSKNAVAAVLASDSNFFQGRTCAAVGSATATALREAGAAEVSSPTEFNAEKLATMLIERQHSGQPLKKVLFLRGERVKAELAARLQGALPKVAYEEWIVYRTRRCHVEFEGLLHALEREEPILLCVSSRAALDDFLQSADDQLSRQKVQAIRALPVCAFAESLREDVERLGLRVKFCASGRTLAEFGAEVRSFARLLTGKEE